VTEFLLSTEEECLSIIEPPVEPPEILSTLLQLLRVMTELAPSLQGSNGIFNPYGRVYIDCGHLELAALECDSPYLLALLVERQHLLVARALAAMAPRGHKLRLANNNHSGLLERQTSTWGAHENFLVRRHPNEFNAQILPFLVTRVYGGSGGIAYPSGHFLAGVRSVFMVLDSGGGTTSHRAIHSTGREEHHMGAASKRFRYHLILGDGHRSQFNLALQFGATALALKAIDFDPELPDRVAKAFHLPLHGSWVKTLEQFNLLAEPGKPPRVAPMVVEVQRQYHEAACRYAASLSRPAAWIARLLEDWRSTLDALERGDSGWLAARLDTFAKHEVFSRLLAASGHGWKDLPGQPHLFSELALADHDYHDFSSDESIFQRLDDRRLLAHRVGDPIPAGKEAEPWVPETATRARARARFIRDHAGTTNLLMDWSCVHDLAHGRWRRLDDPFALEYGPWVK
jgi:proteasome accessory factor A